MSEAWRPVVGHPRYEVSDAGRIRSVGTKRPGLMKPQLTGKPPILYASVRLDNQTVMIHVAVLEAFDRPRPEGMVARHLDGDRTRNVPENLAWGTPSQNAIDVVEHGKHPMAARDACSHGHPYVPGSFRIYFNKNGRPTRRCWVCDRRRDSARSRKATS